MTTDRRAKKRAQKERDRALANERSLALAREQAEIEEAEAEQLASASIRRAHTDHDGTLLRAPLVTRGVWVDDDGVSTEGLRRVDHFKVMFSRSRVLDNRHWSAGKQYRRDFEIGHEGGMIASDYEKEGGKSAGEVGMSERRLMALGRWQDANRAAGPMGRSCLQAVLLGNMTLKECSVLIGLSDGKMCLGVLIAALETLVELYTSAKPTG